MITIKSGSVCFLPALKVILKVPKGPDGLPLNSNSPEEGFNSSLSCSPVSTSPEDPVIQRKPLKKALKQKQLEGNQSSPISKKKKKKKVNLVSSLNMVPSSTLEDGNNFLSKAQSDVGKEVVETQQPRPSNVEKLGPEGNISHPQGIMPSSVNDHDMELPRSPQDVGSIYLGEGMTSGSFIKAASNEPAIQDVPSPKLNKTKKMGPASKMGESRVTQTGSISAPSVEVPGDVQVGRSDSEANTVAADLTPQDYTAPNPVKVKKMGPASKVGQSKKFQSDSMNTSFAVPSADVRGGSTTFRAPQEKSASLSVSSAPASPSIHGTVEPKSTKTKKMGPASKIRQSKEIQSNPVNTPSPGGSNYSQPIFSQSSDESEGIGSFVTDILNNLGSDSPKPAKVKKMGPASKMGQHRKIKSSSENIPEAGNSSGVESNDPSLTIREEALASSGCDTMSSQSSGTGSSIKRKKMGPASRMGQNKVPASSNQDTRSETSSPTVPKAAKASGATKAFGSDQKMKLDSFKCSGCGMVRLPQFFISLCQLNSNTF